MREVTKSIKIDNFRGGGVHTGHEVGKEAGGSVRPGAVAQEMSQVHGGHGDGKTAEVLPLGIEQPHVGGVQIRWQAVSNRLLMRTSGAGGGVSA